MLFRFQLMQLMSQSILQTREACVALSGFLGLLRDTP